MNKYKAKHLMKTSEGCPAQWEGETIDNREIYIRFRWSYFSCSISQRDGHVSDCGEDIFSFGLELDELSLTGRMETEEMKNILEPYIDFSECVFKEELI